MKAKFSIINSLSKDVFVKVMHCSSSKDVLDTLKKTYHGTDRVKEAKIQLLKSRFENIKMSDNEKVEDYLLKIDEIVNGIRGLGEKNDDIDVVKKVLRSLPDNFDSKICYIEETRDINKYTMEDIHGALVAYEMRKLGKQKSTSKEAAFKVEKKVKQVSSESEDLDVLEAHFSRKLKKEAGIYKGKIPFKSFSCGKIAHFASKCPYNSHDEVDDKKEKSSKNKFYNKKKFFMKKKSLISDVLDSEPSSF